MATATKTKARASVKPKAKHYSETSILTSAARLTIYTAKDSAGKYYGSFALEWSFVPLDDRRSQLTPAKCKKFDSLDLAWSHQLQEARAYVERLRLNHLSDDELAAIQLVEAAIDQRTGDDELAVAVGSAVRTNGDAAVRTDIDVAVRTADPTLSAIVWEEAKVECDLIDRHPQNREVPIPSVADLAESIRQTGRVLERVKLRDLGNGRYQMLSGERRWKAVHLILEWETIDADVATMSDAAARTLLTICNTQRQDLNDIEKATDLQQLCMSIADGGAGMTQRQAGQLYGMSQSHVANLIRVLGAPASLRQLIIAGEIPSSFVRLALPYLEVAGIEKEIVKVVGSWHKQRDEIGQAAAERIPNRDYFREWLGQTVVRHTRSMVASRRDWYVEYQAERERDRVFDPTPEQLSDLRVITVDGYREKESRAANVKLWDKLQAAALPAAIADWKDKKKKKADRSSKKGADAERKRTPAEQKQLEKKHAEQLAARIRYWRHTWLSGLVVERLTPSLTRKIVTWLTRVQLSDVCYDDGDHAWGTIARLTDEQLEQYDQQNVRAILTDEDRNPKYPRLTWSHVDDLATMAGIDVAKEWSAMQRSSAKPVQFETFFLLHDKSRLEQLAAELKVSVPSGTLTKQQLVGRLTGQPRALALPKSIAPLTTKARKKK